MNIEEFVNEYLKEHRHDVLLSPYNGLIDFANAFKEQMMKEAVECYYGYVNNCTKVFLPEETPKGVKEGYAKIVILKNDE